APAGGITFDIATADGTAQDHNPASEDNDYVASSVVGATIPQEQTTYTFDVTVNGDTSPEPDQTFFVNISNPSGGGPTISGGCRRVLAGAGGGRWGRYSGSADARRDRHDQSRRERREGGFGCEHYGTYGRLSDK